jgi:hypothetical protein
MGVIHHSINPERFLEHGERLACYAEHANWDNG